MNNFICRIINLIHDKGERPPLFVDFKDINSDLQFAYRYAAKFAAGKSILDYGCGGGYGTEYLSRFTNKPVVGFDVDAKTISYANRFYQHQHLCFVSTLNNLHRFDMIVSFQVIEHLNHSQLIIYFNKLKSLCKPNGLIIIATPNKNITSYKLKTPIFAHHFQEFTPDSFKSLLTSQLSSVKLYGQISSTTYFQVKNHSFSYKDTASLPTKIKVIRFLSQIPPVRYLTGRIPQFFKNLLLLQSGRVTTTQKLVTSPRIIANSYILIAFCHP